MDITTVVGAGGTTVTTILVAMYKFYTEIKKREKEREKEFVIRQKEIDEKQDARELLLAERITKLEMESMKHSEEFKRLDLIFESIKKDALKFELVVENKMDKFDAKLDKIYQLLLNNSSNKKD